MDLAPSTLLASRHARLRAALVSAGCDAVVITRLPHVFYLANLSASSGLLVVTSSDLFLVLAFRYLTDAGDLLASEAAPPAATLVPVESSYDEALAHLLESLAPGTVGFEADDLSVTRHAWLRARLPPAIDLQPTSRLVERLRRVKDSHEIATLRHAARALAALVPGIVKRLTIGLREREVAAAIESAMRS